MCEHPLPSPSKPTHPRASLSNVRPVVLQAVRRYLPLTENWIYEQIRQASGFYPVVVCDERVANAAFSLPSIHPTDEMAWGGAYHFINRLHRRVSYGNWPGTYAAVMKQYQPALIHAHFGDRGVFMLDVAKQHNIPLITTFYGYDVSTLPLEPKWVPRLKRLFTEGSLFLCEGPFMAKRLIQLGAPVDKVRVHHLGVNLESFPFKARTLQEGPIRILMAASFREKKGLAYGLEAFARVASRAPGRVHLTLIGDGPLKEELVALAKQWRIMPFIDWLGYQPHEVLLREAQRSHLFMSPSVVASDGDTEGGAPVSLLEVQATGLPVLATTHADIPEVTRPGLSAYLVPERDVDALEERLEHLLDNPESWASMGLEGRRHVEAEFDSIQQGQRLEALYHELLAVK
jgi:colanic acid/amylovoran biosynthesis glycosyltransferase